MVAFTFCAGCTTGNHEAHIYWIQQPPEGGVGGFACRCSGPDECAGNGERLLRSLFGDAVPGQDEATP